MENLIWPQRERSPPPFHYLKLDKSFDYSEPMLLSSKETVLQFALTPLNPNLGFKYTFETIIIPTQALSTTFIACISADYYLKNLPLLNMALFNATSFLVTKLPKIRGKPSSKTARYIKGPCFIFTRGLPFPQISVDYYGPCKMPQTTEATFLNDVFID